MAIRKRTTVSYVSDGLVIYFGSAAQSQKAKNIARNNKVSLTINLPYTSWDDIRGLSIGGSAAAIQDSQEMERVGQLMFKKFPQVARYAPAGLKGWSCFGSRPKSFSVLDYRKGFGNTDLVRV
jgi:nitroimidazol reductase NimA-like FMN-containing flavoprotein (pyridoxamine 5'-phosphate oxidase superfamily)